jgi:hypothetical protein
MQIVAFTILAPTTEIRATDANAANGTSNHHGKPTIYFPQNSLDSIGATLAGKCFVVVVESNGGRGRQAARKEK